MATMELPAYHLPTDLSVVRNAAANAAAAAVAAVNEAQKFGGRGSSWSREETSLLLDVYEIEMAKEDANFDKNSASMMVPKFQSIYRTISDLLRAQGFDRSPMQVRERLKRLKRDVREHKQGEFTARVSAIVGRSPYTRPSLIQQAAIQNTEMLKSVNNNNNNTSNNNNNSLLERSLSEPYYPADMLSTEMSYPDDDEPTSESPMSCNAEVPDGHSENEHEHNENTLEHNELPKHTEAEKHTVPSGPLSLIIKKEKTPPPPVSRSPPVSRTPPRPRSQNNAPAQTLQLPTTLPSGFPHGLPGHLSLNPMLFSMANNPLVQMPRVKTPPAPKANCNSCSQTAAEQKKIHSILQKVIADQKAARDGQLIFQREILAHLNMITYSIQTLAAQFAFAPKKDVSHSPQSHDDDVSSIHD